MLIYTGNQLNCLDSGVGLISEQVTESQQMS